jgi:hypothetical protein
MDGIEAYPLVVRPPEQGALVPASSALVVDLDSPHDSELDFRAVAAFLWRRCCQLATLLFIALALLRRLRLQVIELRQQANLWRAQHQRAAQRETTLKERVQQLQGEIREWKRRLFGRKSETSSTTKRPVKPKTTNPASNGTPRPRGQQPGSNGHGRHALQLPAGTITGGMQKLVPLFQPLYELLIERNRAAEHWHCDETRWRVFVHLADKAGFVWYLWVFATKESIVFVLDPTRAHDVPETHFGAAAEGIINVDRYSAYKAMAQVKAGQLSLAFCWAHVRRDFLAVLTGWPELFDWAWSWVEEIGTLYQRNDQRLALTGDAPAYAEADRLLREQVEHMRQRCDNELSQPKLRLPLSKTLTSLHKHWAGLTVFVDHPDVPLDNNEAERRQRGPVVARKNFYGSGSLWSGRLAAMLFSLFQTLQVWGIDTGKWLTAYLTACAKAGGKPPPDPQQYLPWNMTPHERDNLSVAKPRPPDPKPSDAHVPNKSAE